MADTLLDGAPPISGHTIVLTIIGHPVSQVRSPTTVNAELARTGVDAVLIPVDLEPSSVPSFIEMLRGWQNSPGCIVTVPHKTKVAGLIDELTDRAKLLGAVNMVRRTPSGKLTGDMIDGLGFVEALKRNAFEPKTKRAVVFGGGAVGRALLLSLTEAGVSAISFHEPDETRRDALRNLAQLAGVADRFSTDASKDLERADLAVNASPVGMNGDGAMAFDPARLLPHAFVADVVTHPAETPLLAAARAAGLRTQNGVAMADAQMAMQVRFFDFGGERRDRARDGN
jgi:shikimate dehydrogenase